MDAPAAVVVEPVGQSRLLLALAQLQTVSLVFKSQGQIILSVISVVLVITKLLRENAKLVRPDVQPAPVIAIQVK